MAKNNIREDDYVFNYYYQMYADGRYKKYLDIILEQNPDYDISTFHQEIFDPVFIEAYSLEFLIENIDYLDYLFLEEAINTNQIDKIKFVCTRENLKLLYPAFVLNKGITIDLLDKLEKIVTKENASVISFRNIDEHKINILYKLIDKQKEYEILEFFINKFEKSKITNQMDIILEYIENPNLYKLIKVIDDNYFNNESEVYSFLELFNRNILLLENMEITPETIKMFSLNRYQYNITTNEDLLNLLEIREEYHHSLIDKSSDIANLKKTIIENYFNLDKNSFDTKLNNYHKTNLINKDLSMIESINNLNTPEELKSYCTSIKQLSNFFNEMDKRYNNTCAHELVESLTKVPYIVKGREIIKLDGQEFKLLVHKIKGYGDYKLAQEVSNDISKWIQPAYPGSYISTSLISDKFMGTVPGNGTILGFNNIKEPDIYDMGPQDIFTSSKQLANNITNLKATWSSPDELIKNTKQTFNEVAIRRHDELGNATIPNMIVGFDNLHKSDYEVSSYFDADLVLIKIQPYLDKMLNNIKLMLEQDNLKEYARYLKLTFLSFAYNYDVAHNYFSLDKIHDQTIMIINKYNNMINKDNYQQIKEQLELIIKVYDDINSIINYLEYDYGIYEKQEMKNKIKVLQ
ncbi:MAG: hypothetical protein PHE05_05050 [Bacilli bacterium]|nr:hypothetical protein [Bacilli bacterium]